MYPALRTGTVDAPHVDRPAPSVRLAGPSPSTGPSVLDMPGPRWFAPGDPVWRVAADPVAPVGRLVTLFMMAAHPWFAAVLDDPHAPPPAELLAHLAENEALTVFGTVDDAVVTIESTRAVLARRSGVTEDGTHYCASDRRLVGWALCASSWAALVAHQRLSATPIPVAETDAFVAGRAVFARIQGQDTPPLTVRGLEAHLRAGDGVLAPTVAGRRVAARLQASAPDCTAGAGVPHDYCAPVVDAAVGLLPTRVRRVLGLSAPGRDWSAECRARHVTPSDRSDLPATTVAPRIAPPTSLLLAAAI